MHAGGAFIVRGKCPIGKSWHTILMGARKRPAEACRPDAIERDSR
jgi:hypothetical protein